MPDLASAFFEYGLRECYYDNRKATRELGMRFRPIDVQTSDWRCRVDEDGGIRLGFMYVNGLRKEAGQAMAAFEKRRSSAGTAPVCPKIVPMNSPAGNGLRR